MSAGVTVSHACRVRLDLRRGRGRRTDATSTCSAIARRRFDRQRKVPGHEILRAAELGRMHRLALQPRELVDHQPQRLAGAPPTACRSRRRCRRSSWNVWRSADAPYVRPRSERSTPNSRLAPSPPRMRIASRTGRSPDASAGWRCGRRGSRSAPIPADRSTTTRRVGGGGSVTLDDRHVAARPGAERLLGGGKRLVGGQIADDREQRVVRHEPRLVERDEVVARDPRDRLRRAFVRPAVRMEAEDEPIEDRVGDVVGIVVADLQRRQRLPALQLDLRRRKTPDAARCRTRARARDRSDP